MLGGSKLRPKIVAAWVKSGRDTEPIIKNARVFGHQWLQWYTELQPTGRKQDDGSLKRALYPNTDWIELRKGTINGMYSLVASLGWWLKAAVLQKLPMEDVLTAVSDMEWVLESMTRAASLKRPSSESGSECSKKPRMEVV